MATLVEELTAAYEQEKLNHHAPVSADDVPFTFEDITADWLTTVICAKVPGAQVLSHELDAPDEGTTNRRRIFIHYNEVGKAAGLPETLFCKASQGLANRILLGISQAIQGEVNFFNHVRDQLDVEAPVSCHARYNAALNSIVMMRELHRDTIFCTHTTEITQARAEDQLRILAKMHGKFLDSPELTKSLTMFPYWWETVARLNFPQFAAACDQGFGIAEEVIPPRFFARRKEIWPLTQESAERHKKLPHTFTHGDVHLRNWYLSADGRMGLNDWQVVCRGHWSRDLIYALTTSLTIEQRRIWLDELLRYYHDQLQETAGRRIPFDGALDECRRQLLTALMFWTITLNPTPDMPDMQPRAPTLEFIRRLSTAIDDLDAMDSFK